MAGAAALISVAPSSQNSTSHSSHNMLLHRPLAKGRPQEPHHRSLPSPLNLYLLGNKAVVTCQMPLMGPPTGLGPSGAAP